MQKKVIKFKDEKQTEEMCESDGAKLALASATIEPYFWEIIKDVFNYRMGREATLQEVHKIFTDDRVLEGLKLYQEKKVKEGAITDVDVRATVDGETGTYHVVFKRWLPLDENGKVTLIRYRHDIENYIATMYFSCDCPDYQINGHYKANSSLACKHICSVMWKLQREYNMPSFFLKPIEKQTGQWEKSKNVDLVTGLYGLPMKQFSTFLNVLVLRDYKGIPTSLSLSIHREPNKGYEKLYPEGIKPIWLTLTEPADVERLIHGTIKGYVEMLASRKNNGEQIIKAVSDLFPLQKEDIEKLKKQVEELKKDNLEKDGEIKYLSEKLYEDIEPKQSWFQKIKDFFKSK